jgi:hypothetical protein
MEPTPSKASHWHHHLTAWQASGLSQAAYCARHGLKPASFAYWRSKQRKVTDPPLTLVPLGLGTASRGPVLSHPSGWRLELPSHVAAPWLAELLGKLP